MDTLLLAIVRDFILAYVVAICWGILFGSPRRVLMIAGLLGGLGHCLRFVLLQFNYGLIISTLAGSVIIGLLGIVAAHKVNNPPVVFTMPACITMIPGMYAYKAMLGGIKIADLQTILDDPSILLTTSHNFMLTASLLFTLAIGICVAALLFRQTSVKEIALNRRIKRMTSWKKW